MSTLYFDFFDSIKIPRLVGDSPSGSGQIIFNDEIRGSTGVGNSVSFRPATTGANVQVFASNGTWTKPAGVTLVNVLLIGGGGGGGSGQRGYTYTFRGGGCGGSGGFMVRNAYCLASAITNTVSVTVGAGGTGGAARLSGRGDGFAGNTGGTSSFGAYFGARGGVPGAGGNSSQPIITAATPSAASDLPGAYGSGDSTANTYGFFPGSGGFGGSIQSNAYFTSPSSGVGSGGYIYGSIIGGGSFGIPPTAGTAARLALYPGAGSGGGGGGQMWGNSGGTINTPQPSGAAGGANGGGGGGGGAASGNTSNDARPGAGGAGGSGVVVVISW